MTSEERQMLSDLADKIAKTKAPDRDADAEEFIRTRIGNRPDALYIMTQTVLIQNIALEQARAQVEDLHRRGQNSSQASSGSFLGSQTGRPVSRPEAAFQGSPTYAQPTQAAGIGGGSSFLRSAATTAAGVAAGALAFEGIQSLFGHHGGFGGGYGGEGFLGGTPGSETVINNYYDSPQDNLASSDDNRFSDTTDSDNAIGADDYAADDAGFADDGGDFSDDQLA